MRTIRDAFYERMGLNAYVQGDYAKAERWFRKLEAREPDSLRVLRNLGVILLAKGDAEGAEKMLLREEQLYGASFHRHAALGDLAYARGRRKEAERRYAAALAEAEAGSAATRKLMEARLALCHDEAAFERTRGSLGRFGEAEAARAAGDARRAVRLFDEAAELDPTNWPALNNAGTILLNELGKAEEALERFNRALELSRAPQVARNVELAEAAVARSAARGGEAMSDHGEDKAGEERLRADAEAIFRAALACVEPAAMVRRALSFETHQGETTLVARGQNGEERYALSDFDRVLCLGFGKAAVPMARGLEEALVSLPDSPGAGIWFAGGIVATKSGQAGSLAHIRVLEAGHPVPDDRSVLAARTLLDAGRGLSERDLVIVLVSGGGSAILCAPAEGLTLEDKAQATSLLLASGAPIHEVNCVRKHLSAVKGGRLAASLAPASVLALVLSDVVGDELDAIASGPTVPDPTSFADALDVINRRGIRDRLSRAVLGRLEAGAKGALDDTPKPGDPRFARVANLLVGTNRRALEAAAEAARGLGYATLALSSRITGEAREVALVYLGIGKDIVASGFPEARPACVLAGGETTVTLRGPGRGGRNQEMALAFLAALSRAPRDAEGLLFLAASTDGQDGPTDAAGAFASLRMLKTARRLGLEPEAYLARNDSYAFFERSGGLFRTGPTGTNVCDLQIILVR